MVNIQDLVQDIEVAEKEIDFLNSFFDSETVSQETPWYINIINGIGKAGLLALFNEIINSDFEIYKGYLSDPHLDIGSGSCITPLYIHKKTGAETYCLDTYLDDVVPDAFEAQVSGGFHIDEYASGSSLPYPDQSMGSGSKFYVLHHCRSREESLDLLKEARRVIKQGGYLIIIEEPVKDDAEIERRVEMDIAANNLFHVEGFGNKFDPGHFFLEDELRQQFRQAGFKIVREVMPGTYNWLIPRKIYILR